MKAIAILTYGGIGTRMKNDLPKQFMEIDGKPMMVYTIAKFQDCPMIDEIVICCLDGWQETVRGYAEQYNLSKVKHVVPGGRTNHESIRKAFDYLTGIYEDAIIVSHDGNRPLVSNEMIEEGIRLCMEKGNAVTCIPCNAAIIESEDMKISNKNLDYRKLAVTQTPQMYYMHDLKKAYAMADERGITDSKCLSNLYSFLGLNFNLYRGSEKNIKITNPEDVEIFKVYLSMEEKA